MYGVRRILTAGAKIISTKGILRLPTPARYIGTTKTIPKGMITTAP
jgi:hypothetical protein